MPRLLAKCVIQRQPLLNRAAWLIALSALWGGGYFYVGNSAYSEPIGSLSTPLDGAIPFLDWSVWIYLLGIPMALAPAFVLPSIDHFQRTARAYAFVIVVSLACFLVFPASSGNLRMSASGLSPASLSGWAVQTLYTIDPPRNLFPSLHVSLCSLAAFSIAEAMPRSRFAWYTALVLVTCSITTVKQHFAVDALGGLFLATATRFLFSNLWKYRATSWATIE